MARDLSRRGARWGSPPTPRGPPRRIAPAFSRRERVPPRARGSGATSSSGVSTGTNPASASVFREPWARSPSRGTRRTSAAAERAAERTCVHATPNAGASATAARTTPPARDRIDVTPPGRIVCPRRHVPRYPRPMPRAVRPLLAVTLVTILAAFGSGCGSTFVGLCEQKCHANKNTEPRDFDDCIRRCKK